MKLVLNNNNDIKKFYKNIKKYKHNNNKIELVFDKKLNIDKIEKEEIRDIIEAINIKDKNRRLEYIYDTACKFIDDTFVDKNICEFNNNRCIIQENHYPNDKTIHDGCCRKCHFCRNGCTNKCIGCKLYYCRELRKIKKCPTINDIKILKYMLNWKQKLFATTAIFKTREESIKEMKRKSLILWSFSKIN